MACVALTSLMATIDLEFLQPSPRVSLDDEKAMKSLFQKLSSMQSFLQKESSGGAAAIRDLETKIRDFALEAEDGIEIQLSNILLAKDKDHQDKARAKLHYTLQEVAEDAEELLKIINNTSHELEAKPAPHPENVVSGGSSQRSLKLEDKMVGHHVDFTVIKDQLLVESYERAVISVVGMTGIGKTTLARRVYEDPSVASYFNVQAWVTVPQEYNLQQILCDLLQSMTPTVDEIDKGSTLLQLKEQLFSHLKGKRYLVVLDDIWNTRACHEIQLCFLDDPNGSRILLTTRFYDVAYYASSRYYIHSMSLLDPEESWDLFCKNLSVIEYMAPKFEEIGKHVVELCQRLPQSIVVAAERLSKCNYTLKAWKKIEKELESLGTLDRSAQHSSMLALTYNQLPQHLKVCFLYFAVFPKDSEIQVKKLIRLWIAEGFVKPLGHKALESKAYGYLQELIDKSLVLMGNKTFDGKIRTCRMHSALHSFCMGEAQKEGLFCAVNTRQCLGWSLNELANSSRWLSLRSHSLDYYVLFSSNNPRSLFFFQGDPQMFIPFKLSRTLDFSPSPTTKRVPLHLTDLVFLRYLSIPQWFEGLDDIVSSNRNLQTLIVSCDESQLGGPTLHLQSKVWELPHLGHLELGNSYTVDPPSVVKQNLQVLSWVNPTHCRKEAYNKFPNIKKLKIFFKDDMELSHSHESCSNSIILDNLKYMVRLERLTISGSVGCSITLKEQPMFHAQLKKLRLSGTNIPTEDLRVIGRLRKLEVLKLENAFCDRVWVTETVEFRRLKFLLLEDKTLKQWEIDGDAFNQHPFPMLERLVLRFCYCLEEIPRDFAFIRTLQSIELEGCHPSAVTSVKWIQEEQHQYMGNKAFNVTVNGVIL